MTAYKQCKRCIMDTSAEDITFDENSHCNFCSDFIKRREKNDKFRVYNKNSLEKIIHEIKKSRSKKKYDCIVGFSGGADSSWVLHKTVELGLNPLAVHMDNGWNSELAQHNIENLTTKLGVDLYTYVMNWKIYKSLMQSFFQANVVDIELLYDNAVLAVNNNLAKKFGLKYIISGENYSTEGIRMPSNWNWYKYDKRNIIAISNEFATLKLNNYPMISTFDLLINRFYRRIKWVPLLNYTGYNKQESIRQLVKRYNYKTYPYKHYESIFTRFYQGYILPQKFNIDKRLVHLSTLICSQQMTRKEALELIKESTYISDRDLDKDKMYFIKKMDWTMEDLQQYLSQKINHHRKYKSEEKFYRTLVKIANKNKYFLKTETIKNS